DVDVHRRVERDAHETVLLRPRRGLRERGGVLLAGLRLHAKVDREERELSILPLLDVAEAADAQRVQRDVPALCNRDERERVAGGRGRDEQVLGAPQAAYAALELGWSHDHEAGLSG